jgi:hypothetical protein
VSTAAYPLRPDPAVPWTGAKRRYDLVKEAVIALVVVGLLTILLAAVFSSPDDKPVTVAAWANAAPKDFLSTALGELDGTSGVATYGPPYTRVAGAGQNIIGGLSIERALGVQIPIDTATTFVLAPLSIAAQSKPGLGLALRIYENAATAKQNAWTGAFGTALARGPFPTGAFRFGPVPTMMANLLTMARSGALDGALLSSTSFYQTDLTKPLLFLSDGAYLENIAAKQNLLGSQWGMMNETGNYPGQAWLWLYTFWYQVPPFATSDNADAQVWGIMALLSLVLVGVPFIPGLRSIPRAVPIYRLIWRDYYRKAEAR